MSFLSKPIDMKLVFGVCFVILVTACKYRINSVCLASMVVKYTKLKNLKDRPETCQCLSNLR